MGFISNLFKTGAKEGSVTISGDNTGVVTINGQVVNGNVSGSKGGVVVVASLGPKEERQWSVKDFEGFAAGNNFLVEWSQGPVSAKVVASANIQAMVELKVSKGKLSIEFDGGKSPKDPVKVAISSPSLALIDVSGACQAEVGEAELAKLSVLAAGASEARVLAVSKNLIVKSSGAARVDARFAGAAVIDSSGASEVVAEGFGSLVAEASGAAKITQKGGLCHKSKLWSSGAASIKAQLDGVENTYQSSGGASIKCALANGASVSGSKSGGSGCALRPLSANQEQEARKHGAERVSPGGGAPEKQPMAAAEAAEPQQKKAEPAAVDPGVAPVKRLRA